jgi:hypothetical protein
MQDERELLSAETWVYFVDSVVLEFVNDLKAFPIQRRGIVRVGSLNEQKRYDTVDEQKRHEVENVQYNRTGIERTRIRGILFRVLSGV